MLQIYRGKSIDYQYIKRGFYCVFIRVFSRWQASCYEKMPAVPFSYVFFPPSGFFPRFVPAKTRTGAPYKSVIVLKIKSLV